MKTLHRIQYEIESDVGAYLFNNIEVSIWRCVRLSLEQTVYMRNREVFVVALYMHLYEELGDV